jgi:hypothetical protein
MSNVTEGSRMNEGGRTFQGLDEVRQERVLQQHGHRTGTAERFGRGHGAALGQADKDSAESLTKIGMISGQRQDRHDFRRLGNDKLPLPRCPCRTQHDVTKRSIAHTQRARPSDSLWIELQPIAVKQVVIHERREQIVAGRDRMGITREMQIDILHGPNLSTASTRPSSLDTKDRSQ